jgi:signal transduction histidine kinase
VFADEGPGVAPEIRDRLFQPFVTSGKKGGTGLGLAVARRFVADHGGSLELWDGEPIARGAHFRIVLPLVPAGSVERAR